MDILGHPVNISGIIYGKIGFSFEKMRIGESI